MRNMIKSERGGALIIAMIAAIFLTMLGLVLIGVVREGFVLAASSEAGVQAEALARKGLDEAAALVRDAVEYGNMASGYEQRVIRMHGELESRVTFMKNSEADGLRGKYKLEVVSDVDNYDDFSRLIDFIPDYPYARTITVKSTGMTDSRPKRTVVKVVDIVVSTINPVFKYPLSAAHDITMNGASYVIGDVLTRSGTIRTSDTAEFHGLPLTNYRKQSDYPGVKGFYRADAELAPYPQYAKALPFSDPWMPLDEDIAIAVYVNAKMAAMDNLIHPSVGTPPFDIVMDTGDLEQYELLSESDSRLVYNQWVGVTGDSQVIGDLALDGGVLTLAEDAELAIHNGSLYVNYASPFVIAADLSGSLLLDPGQAAVIRGNVVLQGGEKVSDSFKFKGDMYIEGDLQMIGSMDIDGTIYVKGNVDMKQLRNLNQDEHFANKPLILLVDGLITFADSRPLGEGAANELRAFFYSTQDIEIYGVATRLRIQGGIHGERVILNAVREGDESSRTDSDYEGKILGIGEEPFRFTSTADQLALGPEFSNLRVIYDYNLYTDPPVGIPVNQFVTMFVSGK